MSSIIYNFVTMKKTTVHRYNSVSEYFLSENETITEKRHSLNNKIKDYSYQKDDPIYHSLIKFFEVESPMPSKVLKKRTLNEYRQNKDCV